MECIKCGKEFNYSDNVRWDEHGMGYSTKLVTCPFCGNIKIIKYIVDESLDVNLDERWFKYEF